ncbi:hypothetical protein PQX77_010040 [Marasmius sp. AFHP31]|nr:hypothetical protein PQX77_010040 [Marasmius sp. AFHP31]
MPLPRKIKALRAPSNRQIAFGQTHTSPQKKTSKKNNLLVSLDLQRLRKRELQQHIARLRGTRAPDVPESSQSSGGPSPMQEAASAIHSPSVAGSDPNGTITVDSSSHIDSSPPPSPDSSFLTELPGLGITDYGLVSPFQTPRKPGSSPKKRKKRLRKERTTEGQPEEVVSRWRKLLEVLVEPLLDLRERTLGRVEDAGSAFVCADSCMIEETEIHLYTFKSHYKQTIPHCKCRNLPQSLVLRGFFPTAPSQPRMAISIALLEFYQSLCEQSSDAVTALAGALETTYRRRGLPLLDSEGKLIKDPLRRALGHALEWFDILNLSINRTLDDELEALKATLPRLPNSISAIPHPLATSRAFSLVPSTPPQPNPLTTTTTMIPSTQNSPPQLSTPTSAPNRDCTNPSVPAPSQEDPLPQPPQDSSNMSSGQCSAYLQRLCPACFGGNEFGQSFHEGGDIHVALDGNFHHRHLKSGGDGIDFYESWRMLSKVEVDRVGNRIETARQKPPRQRQGPIPDEVVDADGEAYKAARGESQQTQSKRFDENGLMALVCRHDIPLLAASIDTPGEQQKFAIALIEEFFSMVPAQATVAVLYDIACVIDRSVHIYDILDEEVVSRTIFVTAVMHAYGHQWSCQLYYNPRLRKGMGLTDGEGTERLWSALRKLIGLERRSSRARRIWLLDRQCDAIAQQHREDLGAFINRKLVSHVQKKEADAIKALRSYGIAHEELRTMWKDQCEAQSSREAIAPARMKKELGKVLGLLAEIEALESTIAITRSAVQKLKFPPTDSLMYLAELEQTHARLKEKADALYKTLNIPEKHPSLSNIPLPYIHTLLLARDLKTDIRKRAIASFQEYDQIDQAVGGIHQPIGTRNHQIALKNMTKRKATFTNSVRKFNQFCAYLETNYKQHYNIPVPRPLPVTIAALRDSETNDLWEDVWITNSKPPPRWLTDDNARKGIRAVLSLDRCAEERLRLSKESRNICMWFRDELFGLMVMVERPAYYKYKAIILLRIKDLLLQGNLWSTPFVGRDVFDEQIKLVRQRLQPADESSLPARGLLDSITSPPSTSHAPGILNVAEIKSDGLGVAGNDSGDEEEEQRKGKRVDNDSEADSEVMSSDDEEVEVSWARRPGEELIAADIMNELGGEESDEDEDDLTLTWAPPDNITIDSVLPSCVKGQGFLKIQGAWRDDRLMMSLGKRFTFENLQFQRIDDSRARLDDDCMNNIAHLLIERHRGVEGDLCAYLSTFTVPEVLKSTSPSQSIWRIIRPSQYWTKDKWIIPIHSRSLEHWAVAVVDAKTRRIHLFDSLGSRTFLNDWLPRIQTVVTRLVKLAQDQGYTLAATTFLCLSDWSAHALDTVRRQTNDYDCGIWVLWVVAAVTRGFDYAYLEEKDIVRFRKYLARMIRSLPLRT